MALESGLSKFEIIISCNSLDDIFSNPNIDPIKDYSAIISNLFLEEDVKTQFIARMLSQGNKQLVADNINVLDINQNVIIGKDSPEFMQILFENFDRSLENTSSVLDYTLTALKQVSVTGNEKNSEKEVTGAELVTANWRQLAKKTVGTAKVELLQILNSSNDGKQIIQDELPELIYGENSYYFLIDTSLRKKLVTREQVTELVVSEPTRMLPESFEDDVYIFNTNDFINLLEQMDELLETTPVLEQSQVENARANIEEYLSQHFEDLLGRMKVNRENIGEEGYSISDLKNLKKWDTDKHLLRGKFAENYEEISNNTKKEDIMDLVHLFADTDISSNLNIEAIMKQTFSYLQDEDLQWAISRLATELLQDQKLSVKDMEIFGKGQYSRSVKTGEYILKVGKDRSTAEIPYDERIIQPLNRRKLEGKDGESVFIEVQNLVDKDWYKGLSDEEVDEELYKIYSEMRDRGHRWTDVRKDNVGRLLKPNSPNFEINGDTITPEDSAIGFTSGKNNTEASTVLPAGELVIIDTDFIFEADKSYSGSIASRHKDFEERYIRESAERDAKSATQVSKHSDTTKNEQVPVLLVSAIEESKGLVNNQDIKQMSNSIVSKQKGHESQKDSEDLTKDEE